MEKITKELQKVELDMLKEFIKVCKKLDVNYFLMGGTLIGAIRHKGFIPWDDDIDVGMLREDYEKFIKEGQKYFDKKYFVQTYNTDPNYPACFAKIRNNNTTFIETSVNYLDMNHGIYIDVFPLDNLYKYNRLKDKMINYAKLFKHYVKKKNIIKKIAAVVSKIVFIGKSSRELCEIQEKMYKKKNNEKCEKIVAYCGAWGIEKESHFIEDFKEFILVDFEDIKAQVPVGYDRILRDTYGDYMKLPPKNQRVAHHYADVIDFNKSYKEYVKKNK